MAENSSNSNRNIVIGIIALVIIMLLVFFLTREQEDLVTPPEEPSVSEPEAEDTVTEEPPEGKADDTTAQGVVPSEEGKAEDASEPEAIETQAGEETVEPQPMGDTVTEEPLEGKADGTTAQGVVPSEEGKAGDASEPEAIETQAGEETVEPQPMGDTATEEPPEGKADGTTAQDVVPSEEETSQDISEQAIEGKEGHLEIIPPTFDIANFSKDGTSVIAGRSSPEIKVRVLANSILVAEETTNPNGEFTTIFSLELSPEPIEIKLAAVSPVDGSLVYSNETLFAIFLEDQEDGGEQIEQIQIAESDEGVVVNSPETDLLLGVVTYEDGGNLSLSGSGDPDNEARILLDGNVIQSEDITEEGKWTAELSEVEPGDYLLTIDEVGDEGKVVQKVETPLRIERPEQAIEAQEKIQENPKLATLVTVQKGFTLWGISRSNYGLGRLYVRIYNANKDQIDDPDLIYPGQIFVVPVDDNETTTPLK